MSAAGRGPGYSTAAIGEAVCFLPPVSSGGERRQRGNTRWPGRCEEAHVRDRRMGAVDAEGTCAATMPRWTCEKVPSHDPDNSLPGQGSQRAAETMHARLVTAMIAKVLTWST